MRYELGGLIFGGAYFRNSIYHIPFIIEESQEDILQSELCVKGHDARFVLLKLSERGKESITCVLTDSKMDAFNVFNIILQPINSLSPGPGDIAGFNVMSRGRGRGHCLKSYVSLVAKVRTEAYVITWRDLVQIVRVYPEIKERLVVDQMNLSCNLVSSGTVSGQESETCNQICVGFISLFISNWTCQVTNM